MKVCVCISRVRTGAISTVNKLNTENLRLFNVTVSVSDHGTPPLSSVRQAQVSILVFTPLQSTLILIETTDTTMKVRFNLKYVARSNIIKYGIIVQEYAPEDSECKQFILLVICFGVALEYRRPSRLVIMLTFSNSTLSV